MKRQQIERFFSVLWVFAVLMVLFIGASPALAQKKGVDSLSAGLKSAAGTAKLSMEKNLPGLAGTVIASLLSVVAIAFFMLSVYGGFMWMTARGNEEHITKGKNTIIAAVIGIIIVMGSYVVTNFVLQSTKGSTSSQTTQQGTACAPVGTDRACEGRSVGDSCTGPGELVETCAFIGDPINACRCGG